MTQSGFVGEAKKSSEQKLFLLAAFLSENLRNFQIIIFLDS